MPSATEIVYALGLGNELVGVSHECDFPDGVKTKIVLTNAEINSEQPSGAIDTAVKEKVHKGVGIYHLDQEMLKKAEPDIILTQELCDVCAVSFSEVKQAARILDGDRKIVSLEPKTLADILDNIKTVGEITGRRGEAEPFAMENPEKGIVGRTDSSVRWVSNTTGDDDGVDLTLAAPPEAVLRFRTPAIDLDIPLADLAAGATRVFPAGGVDLRVFARRLPARHTTRELRFEHVDPAPPQGACHAYWIRATQEDGAQAWTSPVYLEAAQAGPGTGDPLRGRSTAP